MFRYLASFLPDAISRSDAQLACWLVPSYLAGAAHVGDDILKLFLNSANTHTHTQTHKSQ